MPNVIPVFDGHNDTLLRLIRKPEAARIDAFLNGDGEGHIDLPRARAGGFAGGFFAIFVPSPHLSAPDDLMDRAAYDVPLPAALPRASSLAFTLAMAALMARIARASDGAFRICRSVADIRAARADDAVAAILHIEGAEAIDAEFVALDVLVEAGLRSIGPVWSRPNLFGHGVPFRYPSGPDTGPGLTPLGRELVRRCNRLRVMIDLSHLNEKGFWDVAGLTDAPLVATHSNAHAVCPTSRNLTDAQLAAIRDSRGMVGINLATSFLRPDGRKSADTPVADIVAHYEHLLSVLGEDSVGMGSDFDGATVPEAVGDVAGLPVILEALRERGHSGERIEKFAWRNWLRVLELTWGR